MSKQMILAILTEGGPNNWWMVGWTDDGKVKLTLTLDTNSTPPPADEIMAIYDTETHSFQTYLGFSGHASLEYGYASRPTELIRDPDPDASNSNGPTRRFPFATDPHGKEGRFPNVKSKSKYARAKGKRKRRAL